MDLGFQSLIESQPSTDVAGYGGHHPPRFDSWRSNVTRISVIVFSSSSDLLLVGVVTLFFTMMDEGIECEDKNLAECSNGGPCQFYQALRWASIVIAKSIIRDNLLLCKVVRGFGVGVVLEKSHAWVKRSFVYAFFFIVN